MGETLVYIQIHFGDKVKNYIAPYEVADNDENVLFTPYMFKDALGIWTHDNLEGFVVISIQDLWERLAIFRTTVVVPPYVISKLENMINSIERHKDKYAGISIVC
jgi:hypothetical protein